MEKLVSIFAHKVDISKEEKDLLLCDWNVEKKLKRNGYLIEKGQVENHIYFVKKGALRIFFNNGSEEICVGFAYDNTLICCYPSFVKNEPSYYYIQALSDCELAGIQRKKFYKLLESSIKFERTWHHLTEQTLIGLMERDVHIHSLTPQERYERMLKRSPHIFQFIPRKYIASYLRMSPEILSRIK
jgi:CRP-like cAMP-binding protein